MQDNERVIYMKRMVSIQDISCIGKCSQTIALPVLSAMGIETAIIPTAVLSTHTMFPNFTFRDLSDDIPKIAAHWKSLDISFDAILTGYIGSVEMIDMIADFYDSFRTNENIIVLDPAFADKGKLYPGFDNKYADAIASLCKKADMIVPNVTEASIIAGLPYKETYDMDYIDSILDAISTKGISNIIITSVVIDDKNGIACRFKDGTSFTYFRDNITSAFHGTGDLFASAFTGALVNNLPLKDAATTAVDYVYETLKTTLANNKYNWYGVDFEMTLPYLINRITQ